MTGQLLLNPTGNSLYSDGSMLSFPNPMSMKRVPDPDPTNALSARYLDMAYGGNYPSFPLGDPFNQARHYKGPVYLGIQALMKAMSSCVVGLERKKNNRGGVAAGGSTSTDQEYVPYDNHPLVDVLRQPNPMDTWAMLVCQSILNWNLHGDLLIWGVPNEVYAPKRLYVLPTPLVQPAGIVNKYYPAGAWRVQNYYPYTGLMAILPSQLSSSGAIIDARDVYRIKNPHPIYRWSPYSPMVGADVEIDLIEMIDRSFWSIMRQGIKPDGILDMPGANREQILATQARLDEHRGPDMHGKTLAIGGGDPDRPAAKWNPLVPSQEQPHGEGWDRYCGFTLAAVCGLDRTVTGLKEAGGFAERWAAKKDAREGTYLPFLRILAELLTQGPAARWGLAKKGVRVSIDLPQETGYEPNEMVKDLVTSGAGDVNEVRAIMGLKPKKGGDVPCSVYVKLLEKEKGIDDATQQKELAAQQGEHEMALAKTQGPSSGLPSSPENEDGAGALGGKGSGAPKVVAKAILVPDSIQKRLQPDLSTIISKVMSEKPSINGKH